MINLNRTIYNLKGNPIKQSYPEEATLAALPKREDGSPDTSKLPDETVRNVLLNALSTYSTKDKKEILYVQAIANVILDGESIELKDKLHRFLIEVIYDQTYSKVDDDEGRKAGKTKGIYFSWVMSQVLDELGIKEEL